MADVSFTHNTRKQQCSVDWMELMNGKALILKQDSICIVGMQDSTILFSDGNVFKSSHNTTDIMYYDNTCIETNKVPCILTIRNSTHEIQFKLNPTMYGSNHVYFGEHKDDIPHGYGMYFSFNSIYIGYFCDGEREGSGTIIYSNNLTYIGDFHNGQQHGKCIVKYHTGDIFEGIKQNDIMMGTMTYKDNTKYIGIFIDETTKHGQGKFIDANNNEHDQLFNYGTLQILGID